ncbi:MAG: glycosyltransferase family 4 protein [Chloroflexota bacterium]
MRILYFSRNYSTHDHRFLSAIVDGGHETFFLKLEGNHRQFEDRPVPSQVEQILWDGGQREFRWRDVPRLTLDLKRVIHKVKPDLIHAGPIQSCAFLVALAGFHPLFTMSWGYDLMDDAHKSKWMERVTRYTLQRSTFFTSDSNVTCQKAIAYGMNPEHTVVFPWGVDLDHFRMWNAEGRTSQESFVLFCNRGWEPYYGVDILARAFVKVAQQNENVSLILLSGGSQGAVIRGILQNGGVLDRVTFGGQVSQCDLPNWYHDADIYISPSRVDGSSVSLIEALACGLPCLVSDIPGNREWITEGENGWLFRDGDANHLAEKILAAIAQREKLPEIGRAGRRSAEMRADWQKNAGVLMNAYESAVKLG